MSRKDYVAVAAILRQEYGNTEGLSEDEAFHQGEAVRNIATGLADHFASDNPNFDYVRFLAACGMEATA